MKFDTTQIKQKTNIFQKTSDEIHHKHNDQFIIHSDKRQ